MMESRIVATKYATDLIRQLSARYGPLAFQIQGNSKEGYTPQCVPDNSRFLPGDEVYLGEVEGCPCYVSPEEDDHHGRSRYFISAERGAAAGSLEEAEFKVSTGLLPAESAVNVRMFSYLFGYRDSWG
ncbi:DUF779 domain-containing protein [Chitinophaga sp. GCM10012297]|uniref:DUF779 domain-containing protein n=1 Tax=Chitinophaga chungangae TaxID=2821488 RepID=A0ABS3YBM5_9BACT|nr:DUF779 domain-containing protein [Chitinophaga chungangae]MBO9152069.1 DUF779 domain-containing protein [Chitinophaga chungangae]